MELPEQEGPGFTFWKYVGEVVLCVQADETLGDLTEDLSVSPWQEGSRDSLAIKGM